jgi:hypothetical protein
MIFRMRCASSSESSRTFVVSGTSAAARIRFERVRPMP